MRKLSTSMKLLAASSTMTLSRCLVTASAIAPPKNIKVYYGNIPFWRAEVVRLGLFVGGVEFDDIRDKKRDELIAAGKLPFGAVPVIEVDGKILSQTQAMASYVGKVAGISPEDPWDCAKVDECINGCTDVTATVGKTFGLPDDEKLAAREALVAEGGRLALHLGGLERICAENGGCGFAVGSSITTADIAIWRLVGWLSSGALDGIPKDYVATNFPAISKVVEAVDGDAKVQQWKEKFPEFYAK